MIAIKSVSRNAGLERSPAEEKKAAPRLTFSFLRRIFRYVKPYRIRLGITVLCIIMTSVLNLFPSVLAGKIVDDGFLGRDFGLLFTLILVSVGVSMLANVFTLAYTYLNAWISYGISRDIREELYRHLQEMPHSFFVSNKQGDIVTRMTGDISGVESIVTSTFTNTLSNIVVLAASLLVMFQTNWRLALVGVVIIPAFIIPMKSIGGKRWALTRKVQAETDGMNQILSETLSISGQQTVKLFTNEPYELARYKAASARLAGYQVKAQLVGRSFRMFVSTFGNVGPALIYLAGGISMLLLGDSSLTVGDITVMVALLGKLYRPVERLLDIHMELVRASALFGRIFELLDLPADIQNPENPVTIPGLKGRLTFSDVCFRYKEQAPVLEHISFEIPAGKTVALVGASGVGKSTIANLITRMYDADSGEIRLDGRDVKCLELTFLRSHVGVVTQDNYLFNDTIRSNLLYAKAGAGQEEMEDACRKAGIHDFICRLPEGYDTVVGNRGVRLSGGERQRLAIARTILKNPKILIWDEATSALDSITEQYIQDAIMPFMENRTCLLIAHRLSTILRADLILVLDGGRIVEKGSHEELLEKKGRYADLYRTQFQGMKRPDSGE